MGVAGPEWGIRSFSGWLWQRYRRRWFWALWVVLSVGLVTLIVAPAVAAISLLFELTLAETLLWGGTGSLIWVLGSGAGIASSRELRRPVQAWAAGDRSGPEAAWSAALRAPEALTRRGAVILTPLQMTITTGIFAVVADLSWSGFLAVEVAYVFVSIGVGLLTGIGLHALFLPVLREVAPVVPWSTAPQERSWTFRGRFFAGVLSVVFCNGIVAAAAASRGGSTEEAFVLVVGSSLVVALYFALLFSAALVGPTLDPLVDLTRATQDVREGDYSSPVPITSSDELGDLSVAFNDMLTGLRERQSLQAAFGSYVDPSLAERLLEQDDSVFDGEEVTVTVFFADVRDFTAWSERATAQQAVQRLNRLFEIAVPIIREAGGHANHFIGDCVLAVFGTPQPLDDHADRALATAIEVQRQVITEFGEDLRIGIGINTGEVIAGTIGGGGKLEFTVIGDAVNVASRVEQLTKVTGDPILLTEATRAALSEVPHAVVDRGPRDVVGKAERVHLHGVRL